MLGDSEKQAHGCRAQTWQGARTGFSHSQDLPCPVQNVIKFCVWCIVDAHGTYLVPLYRTGPSNAKADVLRRRITRPP